MNALSLNFRFYMVMGTAAWAPSGPSFQRHAGLTIESTRGSCMDPPTICQRTLIAHPSDLLTGSKSSDPMVQSLLTRSMVDQAFRALLTRFGPTQVGPKDLFLPNKPPVLFISAQIWAFSCLAHFLHFFYLFFIFIIFFINTYKIYIRQLLIPK